MLSFFHAFGRVLPFALVLAVVPAAAQHYPSRPVTIVVGYTPGATSDLVARTIGERLNAAWGQSVIVDNRSGVGGNIAAAYDLGRITLGPVWPVLVGPLLLTFAALTLSGVVWRGARRRDALRIARPRP